MAETEGGQVITVHGFGRVGSYAKAKVGRYCRRHRYWQICRYGTEAEGHGYIPVIDIHFKTGKEAASHAIATFGKDRVCDYVLSLAGEAR